MKKTAINNLKVDENLLDFIDNEVIPGTGIDPKKFWSEFDKSVHELSPKNKELIQKRDDIQKKIDQWHLSKKGSNFDKSEYINFLKSINYKNKYSITNEEKIYLKQLGFNESDFSKLETDLKKIYK